MSICASVIYPNKGKFDMDYYLKTHMPLVAEHWKQYGLKEWKVTHFKEGLQGEPDYIVEAILHWESMDGVKKAVSGPEAKIVFGDVANFTDIQPIFTVGDVTGSAVV